MFVLPRHLLHFASSFLHRLPYSSLPPYFLFFSVLKTISLISIEKTPPLLCQGKGPEERIKYPIHPTLHFSSGYQRKKADDNPRLPTQ